ncbi:hypothetical protein Lbuc_2239 [Lentilactobacillus buchneri NRRL B-30929]|uniref:hypothetical protein n=1 Tax=Lentilactobacillus buchneri TaxID=1581 RepID=UPI00020762AF|nr:hypothetical protein [Lentilactobacillus buchneri]AEB74482.1 hypothetical protein Lbuc_2239 [Lentilactobacillus buchneri NRRL B-30929]
MTEKDNQHFVSAANFEAPISNVVVERGVFLSVKCLSTVVKITPFDKHKFSLE